jgi:hypothetical protein
LPQGFKNSPTIFGTAWESNLKVSHPASIAAHSSSIYMTFCWLDQHRRLVWKELTSFSPFCGRQNIRFAERRLIFARILSNTSGFTCHKDNVDWGPRGNRLSAPFQPPRPIDRLENF